MKKNALTKYLKCANCAYKGRNPIDFSEKMIIFASQKYVSKKYFAHK